MRSILMLALLILVVRAAKSETINSLITIPIVSTPPNIDGTLSEGEWSNAAKIPYFVTVRGETPDRQTTARICYTDRALYVAFECGEDSMSALKAEQMERDSIVWRDDSVELFIQPGSSLPYYHIAVNSLGTTYDAVNMKIMESDISWDPKLKAAGSKGDSAWFVEIEIPIADLGVKRVSPGDSWRVNLCRERKTSPENTSWSLLRFGEATFADPERFGTLVFGDANTPLIDLEQFVGLPNGVIRRSGRIANPSRHAIEAFLETVIPERRDKKKIEVPAETTREFGYTDKTTDEGNLISILEVTSEGKTIYRVVRPFHVPPIRARAADLSARIEATGSKTLKARLDAVRKEIGGIHKSPPERVGEIERALDQLDRGVLAARLSPDADQPLDFVAWATDPWIPLRPGDLPAGPAGEITASVYRGERIYAAANITNLSGRTLDVRITPSMNGVPADRLELHTCAFVPEEAGSPDLIGDALPLANSAGIEVIPAGETRQAFLVVRTDGLKAGEYSGSIEVAPTIGGEAQRIDLRFTILPLDLPDEPKPWICTWGNLLSIPWTKPNQRRYLEDALDHGVNIFFMNPASVAPKLSKDGSFPPIDFASLDRQFRDHAPIRRAVGAYNVSIQFTDWAKEAGIEYMSDAYRKAFIAWMRLWIDHVKSLGLSYDDFAFELVDEPAPEDKLRMHIDTGKLIRDADPQARVVCTTNFSEMDKLERIEPYVDIWVPQGKVLEDAAAHEFMKRTGKEMWMYVCEGDSKRRPPVAYYRVLPWQAFRYDLAGWGFFAHMWQGERPWESVSAGGKYLATYSTVYPGLHGPVTSRRWECYYKGHEDFRALNLLKSLVVRAEKAGVDGIAAKRVLDEAMNGSVGLQKMKASNSSDAEASAFLSDIRRKVADATMKLSKALEGKE